MININTFKSNKEAALAFIASALRTNLSYEDGYYYFHFTAEDGVITAFNDYSKAETTVTAAISVEDMCDAAGMEYDADLGDILVNFEDTERFNEVVDEIYDSVIEELE